MIKFTRVTHNTYYWERNGVHYVYNFNENLKSKHSKVQSLQAHDLLILCRDILL